MVKDNSYGIAPLQDKMLDILKHFISVCEENGLRYCACGGTCIGALRHQGFIPWDDDLDVYMPRPDYEKLWQIYDNTKESKFKLCRTTSEKNYHHRVMQMVDVDTTFINKRSQNEDIEHGVYIDIIPLDTYPKNVFSRFLQKLNAMVFSIYNIQCLPEYNSGRFVKFGTSILLKIIKNPDKRYGIWKRAEMNMTKYNWCSSEECIDIVDTFKSLFRPFPKRWFKERTTVFEDIKIRIPYDAEEYCSKVYGNYMEFPPPEKRKVQHNTVLIDLENSYTKYKGQYYCVGSF